MIVAIHQPNYLPWLGYFRKIAKADIFVFLDDVQFSKNGYINRVQILGSQGTHWLSVPVTKKFGLNINETKVASHDWVRKHRSTLRHFYQRSPEFDTVWSDISDVFDAIEVEADLATINMYLVKYLAGRLGLKVEWRESSEFETGDVRGDDRLIALMQAIAPGQCYLSGASGAKYQSEVKFSDAGLSLKYSDTTNLIYPQIGSCFTSGLSALDAVFMLGWEKTRELLSG